MTNQTTGKGAAENGHSLIWAFALFAVICGAILILSGESDAGPGEEKQTESIQSVSIELEAAASALEDKNYGRTKIHLRMARAQLSRLEE
jgi:hypothetical protein